MIKTFGATPFSVPGVGSRSLGKPAARFPAAVAGDADLVIAVDRQQTRLATPLESGATTMTVLDASAIVAYNLLSIDNEIVQVTGAPIGNAVPIQRGFDGTTPALHLASSVVSGFIDAYHHNTLVAEVEAIETALGANLSRIPSSPFVVSSAYDFASQSPGGPLVVGANSITLSPVPAGVNGSDTNHWLYISGGTGTAEAAKIIGGSATAGAPSGTLIVQCANTHSGAWTIESATDGIQEAIQSLPASSGAILSPTTGGGTVIIPVGSHPIYVPIYLRSGVTIQGTGGGSRLIQQMPNNSVITTALYNTTQWGIRNLTVQASASHLGWVGLDINAANSGIVDNVAIFGSNQPDSIAVLVRGTKNGDGSYDFHNFSANNAFSNLIITGVTRGIVFTASGLTPETEAGSTQNYFYNIEMNIGVGPGIDFVSNTDTNYFFNVYIGYGGDATHPGVVFNSGNPTANTAVGGNHFFGLHVTSTNSASVPLKFNYTDGNFVHSFSSVGATTPYTLTANSKRCYVHGYSSGDSSNTLVLLPNNVAFRVDDGTGSLRYFLRAVNGTLQFGDNLTGSQILGAANVVGGLATQVGPNWSDGTTGANNAIQAGYPAGGAAAQSVGTILTIKLSHSLQAGANTLAYAGGAAAPIKSHRNPANDIGTAYVAGGIITLAWNGSVWQDMSQ